MESNTQFGSSIWLTRLFRRGKSPEVQTNSQGRQASAGDQQEGVELVTRGKIPGRGPLEFGGFIGGELGGRIGLIMVSAWGQQADSQQR